MIMHKYQQHILYLLQKQIVRMLSTQNAQKKTECTFSYKSENEGEVTG